MVCATVRFPPSPDAVNSRLGPSLKRGRLIPAKDAQTAKGTSRSCWTNVRYGYNSYMVDQSPQRAADPTERTFAMSLTHAQIWGALDRLAARAGLSASGLAKKAGLDPTTFNKSKRITPDGRPRWPSTESVAKSLAATGCSVEAFVSLIDENARPPAKS